MSSYINIQCIACIVHHSCRFLKLHRKSPENMFSTYENEHEDQELLN